MGQTAVPPIQGASPHFRFTRTHGCVMLWRSPSTMLFFPPCWSIYPYISIVVRKSLKTLGKLLSPSADNICLTDVLKIVKVLVKSTFLGRWPSNCNPQAEFGPKLAFTSPWGIIFFSQWNHDEALFLLPKETMRPFYSHWYRQWGTFYHQYHNEVAFLPAISRKWNYFFYWY